MQTMKQHTPIYTTKYTIKKMTALFVLMFLVLLPVLQAQEWLKYEVAVEALIVPVFAMDKNGDPVLDLKKDELSLQVDGKPIDISYFKAFKYTLNETGSQAEMVPVEKQKNTRRGAVPPERVVFIVVDTIFNSSAGVMRSRAIATELINKAPPTDRFILLEFSPGSGLVYRGGPNIKREQLLAQLKEIAPQANMWSSLRNTYMGDENGATLKRDELEEKGESPDPMNDNKYRLMHHRSTVKSYLGANVKAIGMEAEMEPDPSQSQGTAAAYKGSLKQFSGSLEQLKYALKTITKPKIVFMLSEGMARGALQDGGIGILVEGAAFPKNNYFQGYLLDYLRKVVQAINEGGSLMYTINPRAEKSRPDQDMNGEMSLKYLAAESGGKYFTGRDTKKVIAHIRNTTTAYYEVAFHLPQAVKDRFDIRFKCKRKGIRLHSLTRSERTRSYKDMEPVQKKVFAVDTIRGGNWSRMVGHIVKVAFRKVKEGKKGKSVTIPLSDSMRNTPLDIFTIHMDPKSGEVDLQLATRTSLASIVNVTIKNKPGKTSYVLVIEPKSTNCIYNRV